MKITKENFVSDFDKYKDFLEDNQMRSKVQETFELMEFYDEDESIKKSIDQMIEMVNLAIDANAPKKKESNTDKPKKEKYEKPTITDNREKYEKPKMTVEDKPKKKDKPTKKPTTDSEVKLVDVVPLELTLFNSFANLFNPKSRSKKSLKVRAVELLKKMQKAIVDKKIRKTSEYAEELKTVQKALVSFCNGDKKLKETVSDAFVEKVKKIGKSSKVSVNSKLVKKFIDVQSNPTKESAKDLLKAINDAIEADLANDELKAVVKPLDDYTTGKTKSVEITERSLRGLRGVHGLSGVEDNSRDGVISSVDLMNKKFDLIDLGSKWNGFFGMPEKNFRFMFYGLPGNGKSTLALKFAGHLSMNLGMKVLYVSSEERLSYTLRDKIARLNVGNSNLTISSNLAVDLNDFDVIFLDSVNNMRLTTDDLNSLPSDKAYVFIFQTTKDGQFRGEQGFSHDVDTVVEVKNMRAVTGKNRFAPGGKEIDVI